MFSERIALILEKTQLSPREFAEKMGIQRSAVSHLLSGRNKPSFDFISRLSTTFPELNTAWLLHGKGEAFSSVTPVTNPANEEKVELSPSQNVSEENVVRKVPVAGTAKSIKHVIVEF